MAGQFSSRETKDRKKCMQGGVREKSKRIEASKKKGDENFKMGKWVCNNEESILNRGCGSGVDLREAKECPKGEKRRGLMKTSVKNWGQVTSVIPRSHRRGKCWVQVGPERGCHELFDGGWSEKGHSKTPLSETSFPGSRRGGPLSCCRICLAAHDYLSGGLRIKSN